MRDLRVRAAVTVVLALTASACVSAGAPGVRTDAVQTDIVFDAAEPETTPVDGPAVVPVEQGPAPLVPAPFRNRVPDRFAEVRFSLDAEEVAADCPGAPLGAAPTTAAPENASEPPRAGLYRYKISGTRTETINGQEITSTYGGFEPRVIREVDVVSETQWTFQEVEQVPDGVRVTTWQVSTDATRRSQSVPYLGEDSVTVGDPGRGVALVAIEEYDGNGNLVSTFEPVTPVLFMPLPVVQGEPFVGTGVDPKSGQSIRVEGEAARRQAVDACGTLVDGWLVVATITESGGESPSHTDELVFSTERGGQLISRRQQISEANVASGGTITSDRTVSLGQVEPSAAPERGA